MKINKYEDVSKDEVTEGRYYVFYRMILQSVNQLAG